MPAYDDPFETRYYGFSRNRPRATTGIRDLPTQPTARSADTVTPPTPQPPPTSQLPQAPPVNPFFVGVPGSSNDVFAASVRNQPAPTSAQVGANPTAYAGTSWDPSRYVGQPAPTYDLSGGPAPPRQGTFRPDAGAILTDQDYAAYLQRANTPPPGLNPTRNPDVFYTPNVGTWYRPGSVNNQTSADYDRWRQATFGALPGEGVLGPL